MVTLFLRIANGFTMRFGDVDEHTAVGAPLEHAEDAVGETHRDCKNPYQFVFEYS